MHTQSSPGTAVAAASVAAAMLVASATAYAAGKPEPIAVEPMSQRHAFTDDVAGRITLTPEGLEQRTIELDDISNVAVVRITVQPGAIFPWHTHPGPVLASVTRGELVYIYAEDCVKRSYPAGTAFVDPGFDNVHAAFNPSTDEETVVMATFLGAPDEGPLTIPVDGEKGAALDAKCGIER